MPQSGALAPILEALTQLHGSNEDPEILAELARALIRYVRQLLRQSALPAAAGRAQRLLESVSVFLQNHYQYEITRSSVAEQFGMSQARVSQLRREFEESWEEFHHDDDGLREEVEGESL